jgi:hypothetical protein
MFPCQNHVSVYPLPNTCYMLRQTHSRFDPPIIFGEQYRSFISALCSLLYSPVTSCLLVPNISLRTPFSNTLSLLVTFINEINEINIRPMFLLQCERPNVTPLVIKSRPTRCNKQQYLLIFKISSTCFGQTFAHHQERNAANYSMCMVSCFSGGLAVRHLPSHQAHSTTLPPF